MNAGLVSTPAAARAASPLGNAGEPQRSHVVFAVALVFDGIDLGEPLDGEIRLQRQELVDLGLRLLGPAYRGGTSASSNPFI